MHNNPANQELPGAAADSALRIRETSPVVTRSVFGKEGSIKAVVTAQLTPQLKLTERVEVEKNHALLGAAKGMPKKK